MMTLDEAKREASKQWDYVFTVQEIETKPGTEIRRCEGPLAAFYGHELAQQFKVQLHSSTGPIHWLAILVGGDLLAE